ncbi:Post-SET domain,AWS domain,SET domain,SRI, Set2 Rpb1 interacting [Cinara cedri]|uniref:[histone H3]-lysine(36) N-trimethyltransferase n=1 Tax=Cinara cedri TaxID=506608 RepID=A0A5E4MLH2_9HEMI|nr:Post-SET domain,AWS domain,SET domain,SRI, Set2 Rpb1 interacting [Cinara cedri]
MDSLKHVKVKSRWTQSCQIDMLTEESQSSLEMSDSITDVSTSDLNENTDHSSDLNSLEVMSHKTSNNSNRRSLNIKQSLHTSDNNKKKIKHQDPKDIIEWIPINWNDISIYQTKEKSKSVGDISENIKNMPQKPFRRASLSWKFKFTPTNERSNKYYNLYRPRDLSKSIFKIKYFSTNYGLDEENSILVNDENVSLKPCYSDINNLNCKNNEHPKVVLNLNKLEISKTYFNKQEQSDDLNDEHVNHSNVEKTYKVPKLSPIELKNLRYSRSIYRFKEIRSKSLDFLKTKTNILKRSLSCDDIKKLENSVVVNFTCIKPQQTSPKKVRRQSKRIKPKNTNIDIFDNAQIPKVDYIKIAEEMYQDHKNQLLEARNKDKEFDQKLKSTNFTLVNENVYQPDKQALKLYQPSEISALLKLKQKTKKDDLYEKCDCGLSKRDAGNTRCEQCPNRMLKVECGSRCRYKQNCTNKQFQNKQFKKINIIKTAKKGYGICAAEDIPKGVLISEYVGEVISYNEMCDRLNSEEYANLNYMVELNSDAIIDSTSKGNLTRFINHSCDPNSVSEKWQALGLSRIGFFSTRNIKIGEEITFDYQFQVFGAAQRCYCYSQNCRGYIGKPPQITCSDDNDNTTENHSTSKPEEKQKKKRIIEKRIVNNDENKIKELSRQLKEIAELKTGLKADQEMAILNLNRLMVHITDSKSRSHVLRFIRREHYMNKRIFMDFSGLSIIHNWMTSNENDESFKIMILDFLAELPIPNRNTITKSKVLDVVAEWAEIPQDVKSKIESLEYPPTEQQKHCQEIENILPTNNEDKTNDLVEKARALWKKWIILKIVFKIPKKMYQHNVIKEIHSNKLTDESYALAMDIPVLDQNTFKISNKYISKAQNKQTIPLECMKQRKEYELKNFEQERPKIFRKKAMDNCLEQHEDVIKKKLDGSFLQQPINLLNCNSSVNNNTMFKRTRWDCSSNMTHIIQNSIVNYNMQIPCFMPPQGTKQPLVQFPPCHIQPQIFPNNYAFNPFTIFNTPPPPLPNQHQIKSTALSINKHVHQNVEPPDLSPTRLLLKSADTKVFNLINESLCNHFNSEKNFESNKHSNTSCSRAVKSGIDLLARIKVLSNSFKNQPSKLINFNSLKQKSGKTKLKNIQSSDINLTSACDKNNKIIFINEQAAVTSNTLSEDVLSVPKTIPLSGKNKFAANILNSLLKKTGSQKKNSTPKKFVIKNLNSEIITCAEADKEIELYKNMKPQVIKNVVAHVKTTNGFATVMKRQWGIKIKGLQENYNKIPATKRNIMRKGSIHRLSLKDGFSNKTKSVLKRHNSIYMEDYDKKPKEKRVTFLIEGETSPIFPHSEIRPINLNQNLVKQKPLMKCHPFGIRNEPKYIPQTTSTIQNSNLQLSIDDQQLETIDQQLETTDQQLETTDQQLEVTDQQLEVTDQQLEMTDDQQLEMTDDQQFEMTDYQLLEMTYDQQLETTDQQLETIHDQIIRPIVEKFKASKRRRISSHVDVSDQLEQFKNQRIHKIPLNMESLCLDVLKLIPDNEDDVKKVLNYHNLLVRVVVKTLGPYSKKPCQQGRIRNDDDFKYVAKKITENVLLKELQLKRVDKLKIGNNTKDKVTEYIKKYMSRFGEFYKRKPNEKNNQHKAK